MFNQKIKLSRQSCEENAKVYILVGGLKVTYSYQVLGNDLDDVTNDVRDCPGGGPCYVLVHA